MKKILFSLLTLVIISTTGFCQETPEVAPKKEVPKEETVTTSHIARIGGIDIPYKATVGTQHIYDEKGDPKASLFYVAYTKDNIDDTRKRPITFCFNGGPGTASVWLHLGMLGPKRIDFEADGKNPIQPYHLVDNPYSLLDVTDLVFIDPMSTGYSRAVGAEDPKQYHGLDKDIESVAEFIRLYITRNSRWESPKFIAGESYGTTRAAGLALELHDSQFIYLDGVVLISCALNYQTFSFNNGNDLPYILFFPTYAATAFYHKKQAEGVSTDMQVMLQEAERFASGEYARALMKGDKMDPIERATIIEKMSRYIGISPEYIERSNMRIPMSRFTKELLISERRTVGRFDSRIKGIDLDLCDDSMAFDPSLENIVGAFTATFNQYIRADLGWMKDTEYKIFAQVRPWDYGSGATNQYLDVGDKLREVMSKNPRLRVFVGSGYWDLATPFSGTDYTFSHLDLDPAIRSNVTSQVYEGGHLVYLVYPTLIKMKSDLSSFINKR